MGRAYTRFVAASGMTNLADGIATVVWAWMATLLTRDAFLVALMPVALRLPWFLCALPAGIVADRMDRMRLILAMDIVRALAFAAVALAVFIAAPLPVATQDGPSVPWLYALLLVSALTVGTAEVFRDNAAQTVLPTIVPHGDLERANGRLWSVELIGNELLGPALGAVLIAATVWSPFALNAGAFAVAALLLASLRGDFRPPPRAGAHWRVELMEGVAFVRSSPVLAALAWITGVWNLLWMMVTVALVLHVQENLDLGAPAYGLILSAGAVGGIIGSLAGEHVVARYGPARTAQCTLFGLVFAIPIIAVSPNGWWVAATLLLLQISGMIWNTVTVAYRQRVTPNALMGRMNSVYRLLAWGMMPIGLVLSGLMINVSESFLERGTAITVPLFASALGGLILATAAWRALARGFASA
ncbi:MAG: MFS transporter [Pseudomonadota bacterium]